MRPARNPTFEAIFVAHAPARSGTNKTRITNMSFPPRRARRPVVARGAGVALATGDALRAGARSGGVSSIAILRAEKRLDELIRIERHEVVGSFAEPDQLHRDVELLLDGQHDASLG